MKFYTYGNSADPVILLFPGTGCHHKTFDYVLPYLQEHFYVTVVSYDGFDETELATFPDMITETEKIEAYVKDHFDGRVFAAYGCSLGGSFVGLLIQRKNIHIEHGFIGSSDLDQSDKVPATAQSILVAPIFHHILHSGKLPSFLEKKINNLSENEQAYIKDFLRFFGVGEGAMDMSFVSVKSLYNQFYTDLITPLEDAIDVEGTKIHVFYALKMGDEYEKRYLQHFKDPDIRRHNLQHEELLVRLPEAWTKEILYCCGMEGGEAFNQDADPAMTEEAKSTEAKTTVAKGTEAKGTEAKSTEAKTTEAKGTETKTTETAGSGMAEDSKSAKENDKQGMTGKKIAGICAAAGLLAVVTASIVRKARRE